MKQKYMVGLVIIIILASGILQNTGFAGEPVEERWVSASLVKVHVAPSKESEVTARWTTNTHGILLKMDGDWCQVRGDDQVTGIVSYSIDLNKDGNADIAVLEGRYETPITRTDASWFYYFVNIQGKWWHAGFDTFQDCT